MKTPCKLEHLGLGRLAATASLLLLTGVLLACEDENKAKDVSLAVLAMSQTDYDDTLVITTGVVRRFEKPMHYWIEDENFNRVEIFPQKKIAPYLGGVVQVEGRFFFSSTEGRRLILSDIKTK